MTKQIDPGEGYRLLEPGEVVREGDQWSNESRFPKWVDTTCSGSIIDAHEHDVYRRRIEPAASSSWIPVSEQPLPESGTVIVSWKDGATSSWQCSANGSFAHKDSRIVAWMPLPEPYVPPKPERWEDWAVYCTDGQYFYRTDLSQMRAEEVAQECGGRVMHRREVLPGDIHPDDALACLANMRTRLANVDPRSIVAANLRQLIRVLKPGEDVEA